MPLFKVTTLHHKSQGGINYSLLITCQSNAASSSRLALDRMLVSGEPYGQLLPMPTRELVDSTDITPTGTALCAIGVNSPALKDFVK